MSSPRSPAARDGISVYVAVVQIPFEARISRISGDWGNVRTRPFPARGFITWFHTGLEACLVAGR